MVGIEQIEDEAFFRDWSREALVSLLEVRRQKIAVLKAALERAEKETHICGPKSPYSEDECPGHHIRQALKKLEGK